ncbi:MAG: metal-dependent hydrolase [Nevskia sp.]|nr:metal-dependent hydrolase [Nevskia sp.]
MEQTTTPERHAIVPREKLDFGLDGDIPRFWFGGDPFKTRFFDALSTLFPEGEKYFITCVRDYRDRITDPALLQEVRDFTRQEGQHGMVHTQFNNRLQQQGINVPYLLERQNAVMFGFFRRFFSRGYTLAQTAASEHMTAIMAHSFFARREVLEHTDPRIRAMYAWHAIEEIEHKAVAFDVMQKVAKVGYFTRIMAMLHVSFGLPLHTFVILSYMLKVDGFGFFRRTGMWLRGLWWLYKPGGLYAPVLGHYFAYYKPGFHPWKQGQMRTYDTWVDTFDRTRDPVAAGNALHAAGA